MGTDSFCGSKLWKP